MAVLLLFMGSYFYDFEQIIKLIAFLSNSCFVFSQYAYMWCLEENAFYFIE